MGPLEPAALEKLLSGEGFSLPPGGVEKLSRHALEMLRWNRAIRLTAITDPLEVAVKHILDSLLPLHLAALGGRILDVGSGAGYPGIPLAVACPEARVTLLEATAKKSAFLSRMVSWLPLDNAAALNARLERNRRLPLDPFAWIATRATLPPADAAALLVPYLAPGGGILLMASGEGEKDARPAGPSRRPPRMPEGLSLEGVRTFVLPHGMGKRTISVYRRVDGGG